MTHIHKIFFSSIIHISESARNPLHFFPCKSPACQMQEYCTKWTHMITSSPGCKTPVS